MADLLRAFARAIRNKGVNVLHMAKEAQAEPGMSVAQAVAAGKLTLSMIKNSSRARSHGLLARVEDKSGNWCLTRKGIEFLKGGSIPKYVVVSKVTGETTGHWQPEKYQITINKLLKDYSTVYWEETISEGRVYSPASV